MATFGRELLLASVKGENLTPELMCVVHTHWALLSNEMICVGTGDDKDFKEDEKGSELLPAGWSDGPPYRLRYTKDKKIFIMRLTLMDGVAIVSLIRASDMKITSLVHPLESENSDKVWDKLANDVKIELIDPLMEIKLTEQRSRPSLRDERPYVPVGPVPRDPFAVGPSFFLPEVGRTDLDPLGRFGPAGPSGMLVRPGGLTGPYLGYRYDPILPGRRPRGNPPGPDPDHFRPPDFPPDYFS